MTSRFVGSGKKTLFPAGLAQGTGVGASKPSVAASGDKVVEAIADGMGDVAEAPEQRPGALEAPQDLEHGVASLEQAVVGQDADRLQPRGASPALLEDLARRIGLQRRKLEVARGITAEDEEDGAVAEGAHAIEEDGS